MPSSKALVHCFARFVAEIGAAWRAGMVTREKEVMYAVLWLCLVMYVWHGET